MLVMQSVVVQYCESRYKRSLFVSQSFSTWDVTTLVVGNNLIPLMTVHGKSQTTLCFEAAVCCLWHYHHLHQWIHMPVLVYHPHGRNALVSFFFLVTNISLGCVFDCKYCPVFWIHKKLWAQFIWVLLQNSTHVNWKVTLPKIPFLLVCFIKCQNKFLALKDTVSGYKTQWCTC
jgi:hypothetical protein